MDVRVGLLLLLVLGFTGRPGAARELPAAEIFGTFSEVETRAPGEPIKNNQVCAICEEFAAKALGYIGEHKTQTEVIDMLHKSCSRFPPFKQQCITLVDYYVPLFFGQVTSMQPEDFCRKVNLCEEIGLSLSQIQEDSCGICHRTVSEALIKLKDPDTQLEIIEVLLKGCSSMDNYAQKCKKLVFEYGPVIFANAEEFLEKTDICTAVHACAKGSTVIKSVFWKRQTYAPKDQMC